MTTTAQHGGETMLAPTPTPTGATTPKMTHPLAGCVTIDATLDGYLNNARAGTPSAAPNASVQTAASALSKCLGSKKPGAQTANIVGHGMEGLIVTGAGQAVGTTSQHIGIDNENVWSPLFSPMTGTMTGLALYGCHVGAGDDGAQLLHDLAKAVGVNVYGPTGLIYCDGNGDFTLEANSQWQVATPQALPPTIAPPQVVSPPSGDVHLHLLSNLVRTTLEQLKHARYRPHHAVPQRSEETIDIRVLVREVHWDKPFTLPGQHSAVLTGQLHLHFGFGERTIKKQFSVYNHTLLQDDDNPGVYYRASSLWRLTLAF